MKILVIHEVDYFEKPIFEMHDVPEALAKRGHQVAVINFLENTPSRKTEVIPKERSGRVFPGSNLLFFHLQPRFAGVFGRVVSAVSFSRNLEFVVSEFKPDVVLCYAVPTFGWQASKFFRKLGVPLVFRALDVSHKIRRTLFWPLVWIAERIVYSQSSWVSANNPQLREYCVRMGAKASRSSVDLPPLDFRNFKHQPKKAGLRSTLGIQESDHVVLYMGSFFYFSGLTEAVNELGLNTNEDTKLLLVGGGELETELRLKVHELGLSSRVVFAGMVPFEQLGGYFSIADVAINPMMQSKVADLALPNKVLQYLAFGLLTVSTRLKGLESTFGHEMKSLIFEDSPRAVMATALKLAEFEKSAPRASHDSEEVLRVFNYEDAISRIEVLLDGLSRGTGA